MIEARNNHSAFLRELLGNAYVDQPRPDRFEVRGFIDGQRIYDNGELIVTLRGDDKLWLAQRILRDLRAEAEAAR